MENHLLKPSIDWEVVQEEVFVGQDLKCNHKYQAIVRNDTNQVLHIPTKAYYPTTNKTFMELVNMLQDYSKFELAGFAEFQGGRKIMAFLKNPENVRVAGFQFNDYAVIGNSHDGTKPLFIATTHLMIRCLNQFSKPINKGFSYIIHSKSSSDRVSNLKKLFENYFLENQSLYEVYEALHKVSIDEKIIEGLTRRLTNLENQEERVSTRKQNIIQSLKNSIHRECNDIGYNALGLFEGITHYTSHVMNAKEKVFGNLFGTPQTYNQIAFDYIKKLIPNQVTETL